MLEERQARQAHNALRSVVLPTYESVVEDLLTDLEEIITRSRVRPILQQFTHNTSVVVLSEGERDRLFAILRDDSRWRCLYEPSVNRLDSELARALQSIILSRVPDTSTIIEGINQCRRAGWAFWSLMTPGGTAPTRDTACKAFLTFVSLAITVRGRLRDDLP